MKQQNTFTSEVYILDFLTHTYLKNPNYNWLLSEVLFDMFIDVDNYTTITDEIRDEAIEALKIPKSLATLYQDDLDYDIHKSFDTALRDLMEVQFSKDLQEHIENQDYFSHYIDAHNKIVSNFWEAERAVFSITRKQIIFDYLNPDGKNGLTEYKPDHYDISSVADNEEWADDIDYNFKSYNCDTVYVYDEWIPLLIEYSETAYTINQLINNKAV